MGGERKEEIRGRVGRGGEGGDRREGGEEEGVMFNKSANALSHITSCSLLGRQHGTGKHALRSKLALSDLTRSPRIKS